MKRKLENEAVLTTTNQSASFWPGQEEPQDYVQEAQRSSFIPLSENRIQPYFVDADLESVPMELSGDSDSDSASESSVHDSEIEETEIDLHNSDAVSSGPPLYVIPPMKSVYQSRTTNGCSTKFDDNVNASYFVSTSIETQMKAILERGGNWGKI